MAENVREAMIPKPRSMPSTASLQTAAAAMRDDDIGDVIVTGDGDQVRGIVTDRDIVVRAVADGLDPAQVSLGDIRSSGLVTVGPDDTLEDAARLMREGAVRRVPVVEGGRAVGIVSIGDLAIEKDTRSALADISAAPPNE